MFTVPMATAASVLANALAPFNARRRPGGPVGQPHLHRVALKSHHAATKMPALGALVDPDDVAAYSAFLLGPHGNSITCQNDVDCGGIFL